MWRINRVKYLATSGSLVEFRQALANEYVLANHNRRLWDVLRLIQQRTAAETNGFDFWNSMLPTDNLHQGEQIDRFIKWLKYRERVDVLMANTGRTENRALEVLNVDRSFNELVERAHVYGILSPSDP